MRIILAGIIGRYPWGGVTWCNLMYLLGLRQLGHEIYYLEDTCECNYDPGLNAIATDPHYALEHIHSSLAPFGMGERWCYVDYMGRHHGISQNKWEGICRSTDLFLVLSGGCWIWRDNYLAIPRKAFIDSDPAFTQLAIHQATGDNTGDGKKSWYLDYFRTYDRLFTFGSAIGTPRCEVPVGEFVWQPTWQPVCTSLWVSPVGPLPARQVWSTVMTWQIESFQDIGGNKDQEFIQVLGLAERCRTTGLAELELAVNGPQDFLRGHGWACVDAFAVSANLWRYHNYLSTSRAEFSVAKHTYVRTGCGWFSDRSECYLAAGRPAVVQETGFSAVLPTGEGLLAWNTPEQAYEAISQIEADYDRHSRAARDLACDQFEASHVLSDLLNRTS